MQAVRAPWATSSFLLYVGGLTIAFSTLGLLSSLSHEYGKPAFVAWSLFVLVVLNGLAFSLRRTWPLAAGLLAVSGVIALATAVGALESWFGWLAANTNSPFAGFHVGNMIVVAVLILDALFCLRVFRFPLLVLLAAGGAWYLVTDILSSGGNWSATVSIAVGVVLMLIGLGVDRVYGFWVHVVAGLAIGGAVLYFWHSGDTDWILIALASLVYVVIARALGRSSYAVLAAIGMFLSATHFIDKWTGLTPIPFISLSSDSSFDRPWLRALLYGAYGAVLMLLGLWVARRRNDSPPSA
ncbi:MAG: hypothetical protein ACYDA3_01335 [Gaiellaceae bacterium]